MPLPNTMPLMSMTEKGKKVFEQAKEAAARGLSKEDIEKQKESWHTGRFDDESDNDTRKKK